jgi:isopropylmalate/homocitrate/citramalate synthase
MTKIEKLDGLFNDTVSMIFTFEELTRALIYKVALVLDRANAHTVYTINLYDTQGAFFPRRKRLMKIKCYKELKKLYDIKGWSSLKKGTLHLCTITE